MNEQQYQCFMPNLVMKYDEGPKPIKITSLIHTNAISTRTEENKKATARVRKEEKK